MFLQIVADYLGLAIRHLNPSDVPAKSNTVEQSCAVNDSLPSITQESHTSERKVKTRNNELRSLRYYEFNQSVFIDDEYLIKGVAGALLWVMVNDYQTLGRKEFTNRELRLDKRIGLPEYAANLETRLLMLQRRLEERIPLLSLQRMARGRYRLNILQELQLVFVAKD